MRSLRARLILSHILPLLVIIPILGVSLTYLLETQVLLAELSSELERQASLVATLAAAYPEVWLNTQTSTEFVTLVGKELDARLSFYTTDGTLIATTDPEAQASVGQRQEVAGLDQVLSTGASVRVDRSGQRGTGGAEVLVPVSIGRRIVGVIRLSDPLASVYQRFPRTRTFIIWVLAVGLVVGLVAAMLLALDIERPLRRSATAVTAMAEGGELVALREQGPRELRALLRAFNTLTDRLQTLEKGRRRLLANLVHELGRPLGALLSATQALAHGAETDPSVRTELLAGMESEIHRTERLLDDLTRLYDQSVGALELERKETAPQPWLLEVLGPWREAAQEKGLHWRTDLPADLPSLSIDPDRMAQAVGNLVSNAIKYTPAGGEVSVSAGAGPRGVWISVSDTGIGIAPEEQERVFTPHYRSSSPGRFPQGMGLGLSIARDLVVAHGGTIALKSTVGEGSTFTLLVPYGTPATSLP